MPFRPSMSSNDDIQAAIDAARLHTPRFLFRYWNASSGGDANLNTTHRITPACFKDYPDEPVGEPEYEFEFTETVLQHLRNEKFADGYGTCFSSWSHSLGYVFGIAFATAKKDPKLNERAYIAILDTSKCPENVTMHTDLLKRVLSQSIPANPWEYLIYGVISGEAYNAVPLTEIEDMRKNLLEANILFGQVTCRAEGDKIIERAYDTAWKIGMLFQAPLRRVVTAHVLAIMNYNENRISEVAKRIGPSGIPEAWTQDPKLANTDSLECHGVPEALRANEILRQLVVLAGDKGGTLEPSNFYKLQDERAKASILGEATRASRLPEWAKGSWRRQVLNVYESMMCLRFLAGKDPSQKHHHVNDRLADIAISDDEQANDADDDAAAPDDDDDETHVAPKRYDSAVRGPVPGGSFGAFNSNLSLKKGA